MECPLPISKNAYKRFVSQINAVFADDPLRGKMVAALERYLEGDRDFYLDRLPPQYRRAFEMLVFEIDAAIERSARAKRCAEFRKQRKNSMQNVETPQNDVSSPMPDSHTKRSESGHDVVVSRLHARGNIPLPDGGVISGCRWRGKS